MKKSQITKEKMSEARKRWYKQNPDKAKMKAEKSQMTKVLEGTYVGKNNPNFGSHRFKGKPYCGPSWNKGLTKETNLTLQEISKNEMGENNPNWKGDKVTKSPLHQWIKKYKIKTGFCQDCKKSEEEVGILDLANISGEYKRDIHDFKWQCRKCHMIEDGRIINLKMMNERRRKDGKINT